MNEKVLKTLEYNKILNQLSEYACSPEAKKRCLALRPITDKAQIEQLQLQTKDALSRLFRCGNLSFSGVHSVNDSLKRLEIGASLSAAELLSICSLLEAAKRVKAFSRSEKEEVPDDSLTGFFTEIEPLTPLYDEIKRCILAEDEMADDASSTLRSIRRSMRGMNDRMPSSRCATAATVSRSNPSTKARFLAWYMTSPHPVPPFSLNRWRS